MIKHIFIINPTAGQVDSSSYIIEELKKLLKPEEYLVHITTGHNDGYFFAKKYLGEHPTEELRFYACGGDGTLNEVAHACCHHEHVAVGVYPSGSGNDFVKVFKNKHFKDLKSLVNGFVQKIDLLKFDNGTGQDNITINVANCGLDSAVVRYMEQYKHKMSGKKAYQKGAMRAFFNHFGDYATFKVDGQDFYTGEFLVCSMANGSTYGGSYQCAPRADCTDGLIELCLIKKINHLTFINLLKDYKKGLHLDSPKKAFKKCMIYQRCQKVEIQFKNPVTVCTDGELNDSLSLTVEMDHDALNFIIPNLN